MASVAIALTGVSKTFGGGVPAVNDVSLEIGEGEFFSLLGPSGCGKTTTLRMIAGFETPDVGRVVLQGSDVTATPANRRPVNMVFQQYALFPHMTIYDNVAFGLKMRGVPRPEHRPRVTEILRIVSLEGYERRRPRQLSGGQQQRVALARALVNRPAALLLDEPLGALDVKLRKQMQLELKRIQHELGTTFVYVTHDQDEALAMSDRIAVMNGGRVEQLGTPREVYEQPTTEFVADFIGSLNALEIDGVRITVRPEHVHVGTPPDDASSLAGTLAQVVYLGMYTQLHVDTPAGRIVSHRLASEPAARLEPGAAVTVWWSPDEATAALGDAPAGLGADDDRQRDDEHDDGDGDHLR
jgi:spermidine/putrescine transport system ATP-binding protein